MSSEGRFVYADSLVMKDRSSWHMNNKWTSDFRHGDLVPVDITEVLPGDNFKLDLASFIRTATNPIVPIMDNIKVSFASFFVPKRLLWDKTKEFYGENTEGYGIQSEVVEPHVTPATLGMPWTVPTSSPNYNYYHGLCGSLGMLMQGSEASNAGNTYTLINLNPLRAFYQVYNDWFRSENFDDPYLWNHGQTGYGSHVLATLGGVNVKGTSLLPKVLKQMDRFTACLPWAQKGSPVTIPLGTVAPVYGSGNAIKLINRTEATPYSYGYLAGGSNDNIEYQPGDGSLAGSTVAFAPKGVLGAAAFGFADLTSATSATINSLRQSFAIQKYFEQLARTGSKYREYILGMFGVQIGDTTAQMAEYLGGYEFYLNVDQVLQTTGFQAGQGSTLGKPGAISVSGKCNAMFRKGFTEPGYIVTVMFTKHDQSYGQGIDDIFLKKEIWDYYNPKFACLGEMPIKKNRIYASNTASDNDTFGFQEAFSDYRFKKDVVGGFLNPAVSQGYGGYNYWNLASNFQSAPVLSAAFLHENRDSIIRCLEGGESAPDYFANLFFKRTVSRVMPVYSIPGYIDHF